MMVIGTSSVFGSYVSCVIIGLTTSGPGIVAPNVVPSGAAFATSAAPRLPPAPALFSTTNGLPSRFDRCSAMVRAIRSGVAPGPKPTTMRTFCDGQSWAGAGQVNVISANATADHVPARDMHFLLVMAALGPAIRAFPEGQITRRGCHRKSGLPDFRPY